MRKNQGERPMKKRVLLAITLSTMIVLAACSGGGGGSSSSNPSGNTPATAGTLDSAFGTTGIVTTAIGNFDSYAYALAVQSDGKIVAAGRTNNGASAYNTNYDIALVRYNTDGTVDKVFGTNGIVTADVLNYDDDARAIGIQSDGKIVVAGSAHNGTTTYFVVARFTSNGTLDTSFGTGGATLIDFGVGAGWNNAYALSIQPDGKIVVAGEAGDPSKYVFAVARLNTDGSLDAGFGTGGGVTTAIGSFTDYARALVIQGDGKIVVVGTSQNTTSGPDFAVVRYNANGTLDATFGTSGVVTTPIAAGTYGDNAQAVALQQDGRIVVGGHIYNGSDHDFALVRYNTNGSLDTGFGTGGKVITVVQDYYDDEINALHIRSDGKIMAAGYSKDDFALVRYNADGSVDRSFGTSGAVLTHFGIAYDEAYAVAIQSDGKLVAAGNSRNTSAHETFALCRYQ
jgi:uncharacterized delta-60 repeat protein